jgi:hypothetical protein
VIVLLCVALHLLVCCRPQAVATQVLQPAPLQPVQQDAEGRLLPVQPGAAMDRQKWQLMAKASGWTQGEVLLLLPCLQEGRSQQVTPLVAATSSCDIAMRSKVDSRHNRHGCGLLHVSTQCSSGSGVQVSDRV